MEDQAWSNDGPHHQCVASNSKVNPIARPATIHKYMTPIPKETSTMEDVFIFSDDAVFRATHGKLNFGFLMKLNGIIVGESASQGLKVFTRKKAEARAIYLTLLEAKAMGLSKVCVFSYFRRWFMRSMEGSIGTLTRLFWIALVFEFHHVNFSFMPRNLNGKRVFCVGHHFVVLLLFSVVCLFFCCVFFLCNEVLFTKKYI